MHNSRPDPVTCIEEKFGGYKVNRVELSFALDLIRIDGRFGNEVWDAVEGNAPAKANSLVATFSPQNVDFH